MPSEFAALNLTQCCEKKRTSHREHGRQQRGLRNRGVRHSASWMPGRLCEGRAAALLPSYKMSVHGRPTRRQILSQRHNSLCLIRFTEQREPWPASWDGDGYLGAQLFLANTGNGVPAQGRAQELRQRCSRWATGLQMLLPVPSLRRNEKQHLGILNPYYYYNGICRDKRCLELFYSRR